MEGESILQPSLRTDNDSGFRLQSQRTAEQLQSHRNVASGANEHKVVQGLRLGRREEPAVSRRRGEVSTSA